MIQALSDAAFLRFLRALPLLHMTELDLQAQKISIKTASGSIETMCSPYISFWNSATESTENRQTAECYILTSIDKGDRNDEPCFNIVELNSRNVDGRTRTIRRQISHNEHLLMICKAVGLQTNWYPIDDCWCDLAFLQRITVVTKNALANFWGLDKNQYKVSL